MQGQTVRRCARLFVAGLIAAAVPLSSGYAQDRDLDRETSQGKVFRAQLGSGNAPTRFRITQQGGQGLEITAAQVGGSDPYLRVFDADTGEVIAENDDSAGSLSASARLFSERTRQLRIEVTNAAGESSGQRFDLIVLPSDYRPTPPRELKIGQTQSGRLDNGDEQLFHIRAERGQILVVAVNQSGESELDPAADIYSGNTAIGQALASDDDGGGGLNARLRFTVPQTGTYTVRVHGVGGNAGNFSISATSTQPVDVTPQNVSLGRAVTGEIDPDIPERLYKLDQRARTSLRSGNRTLVIEMRSAGGDVEEGGLDPVLDVGFETPIGFSSMVRDDDGGGGTDARIVFDTSELDADWLSRLLIRASGYEGGSGPYTLTVTQGDAE
jgi:hypothetical protein